MGVPLATEQLTVATSVIVADAPDASEAKLTTRLLPEPSQVPPGAEHETKVTSGGKWSVTITDVAVSGPLLVTVIV
jgi:hypothetical protein